MPHDDEDWNSYRRLVLENQTIQREATEKLTERVRALELQAAKWGVIAGAVVSAIAELLKYAIHK